MSSPEQFDVHIRRVAVDGAAYSYSDFEQWYGAHAKQMWEGAAATEHRRVAANGAAYTYAEFVQWYGALSRQMWEEAAATVHSPLDNITTDSATPTPAPILTFAMVIGTRIGKAMAPARGVIATNQRNIEEFRIRTTQRELSWRDCCCLPELHAQS